MAETISAEDYTHDELKAKADEVGVTKNGSSEAIAERINEKLELNELAAAAKAAEASRKETAEKAEEERTAALLAAAAEAKAEELGAAATQEGSKAAEGDNKEASVPPSDPRSSVFDPAPGKTLEESMQRVVDHSNGAFQDEPHAPIGTWFYTVQDDDYSLIDVAAKVGLHDHSQLTAINGVFNGIINVQPQQKVLLPAGYTFVGIDNCDRVGYDEDSLVEDAAAE